MRKKRLMELKSLKVMNRHIAECKENGNIFEYTGETKG